MDKSFTLNIPNPCEQPWDKMSKTANGKFCNHCSAEVIDFTKMTTAQVQAYFQTTTQKVCGRINPFQLQQLNNPPMLHPSKGRFNLKIAIASAITLLVTAKASAQQTMVKTKTVTHVTSAKTNPDTHQNEDTNEGIFTIKGVVKAKDDGLALAGATVKVIGLNQSTPTNPNGMFKLQVKGALKQKVTLLVSSLGYESQKIEVGLGEQSSAIVVNLTPDQVLMGEILITAPRAISRREIVGAIAVLKRVDLEVKTVKPSFFKRVINHVNGWFK